MTAPKQSVKLNIAIEISTDGEIDTGYTVEQWNALTDAERSAIATQLWEEEASSADQGGVWVTTKGAAEV